MHVNIWCNQSGRINGCRCIYIHINTSGRYLIRQQTFYYHWWCSRCTSRYRNRSWWIWISRLMLLLLMHNLIVDHLLWWRHSWLLLLLQNYGLIGWLLILGWLLYNNNVLFAGVGVLQHLLEQRRGLRLSKKRKMGYWRGLRVWNFLKLVMNL